MDLSKPIHRKAKLGPDLFLTFFLPILLLGIFALVSWAFETLQSTEREQRAFMAKCIEFNHPDRCLELDRWGRRDLYDRKDYR